VKCKKIQLKNGLKVLFIESHKSPVVTVQMWVKTGSADETKGIEGISHFIEHLVFKGTKSFKVGEIASTVEECGGDLNAYTSFDQTVFHVTLSSSEINTALKVVNEMTSCPLFDRDEVNNEREVVIEEIKRGLDSPSRHAGQNLFTTVYQKHPYGIPVIGYEKIIKKLTVNNIKQYFLGRYHPKNMFLVLAGNFDTKKITKQITSDFRYSDKNKFKPVKRKTETLQKSSRLKVEKSTFQDNFLYLAFRVPEIKHKDIPALDILSLILGQGDSSRLVKELRIDTAIANSIGASTYTLKDSGLFLVSATYRPENLEKLLSGIKSHLLNAISSEFSAEELAKAKINFESDQYYSLETVDRLARNYASMEFYFNDPQYFDKYLEHVSRISPHHINKVASKWITDKNLSVTCLTGDNKNAQKLLQNWIRNFSTDLKKTRGHKPVKVTPKKPGLKTKVKTKTEPLAVAKPIQLKKILTKSTPNPKTEKVLLPSGTTVYFRQQNESPLVAVRSAFEGGLRAEKMNEAGLAEMTARAWISGVDGCNESQIYSFFDARAAQISPFTGRNTIGISTEFLVPFEKDCGDLFLKVMFSSLFKGEVIEREKQILLHQIESRKDKPAQIAFLKLNELIFANHPYSKDLLGTKESVSFVNEQTVAEYWERIAIAKNLTFSIVGQFSKNYWLDNIEKYTNSLKQGSSLFQHLPLPKINNSIKEKINQKKEQSHIIIAFRGLSLTAPERHALQLLNGVLSGQGGRLFFELRDKNSLAYTVSPIHFEGLETGYTGAYIACSPEKTDKAIEMLRTEFQKLISAPVSEAELSKAKRNIVGSHHIEMQKSGALANMILFNGIYGIGEREVFELETIYEKITAKDIQKLADKIYSQNDIVIVVGP
jgi:zinc protease